MQNGSGAGTPVSLDRLRQAIEYASEVRRPRAHQNLQQSAGFCGAQPHAKEYREISPRRRCAAYLFVVGPVVGMTEGNIGPAGSVLGPGEVAPALVGNSRCGISGSVSLIVGVFCTSSTTLSVRSIVGSK